MTGWLGDKPKDKIHQYRVVNDRVEQIHTITVHQFMMSDVDDPEIYAAQPLLDWQNSESGSWVLKHAVETPMWHRVIDASTFGWRYAIVARLRGADYTFFQLKWGLK